MCGTGLDENNVEHMEPMCKAIMANPELTKDPYVRSKVRRMIQKRIKTAKIGVLDVDGDCGGYNLGFAWISGMLAGRSIKGENND